MGGKFKQKQAKRSKRKEKLVKQHIQFAQKHAIRDKFPSFTYKDNGVTPSLVEIVKSFLNKLDFQDSRFFLPEETSFFKAMKSIGFENAILRERESLCLNDSDAERWLRVKRIKKVGDILFYYFHSAGLFSRYFPYHDVGVNPYGIDFVVYFQMLSQTKSKHGTLYYSEGIPKIPFGESEYTPAFHEHALTRYCERSVCDWRSYGGIGDAFGALSGIMTKFLPSIVINKDGEKQGAIAIYNKCNAGFFGGEIAKFILGSDFSDENTYYYLSGYCPISLSDGFAHAITLLAPGMRGTPEEQTLLSSNIPKSQFYQIRDGFKNVASYEKFYEIKDVSALKWAHENGVPQIIITADTEENSIMNHVKKVVYD